MQIQVYTIILQKGRCYCFTNEGKPDRGLTEISAEVVEKFWKISLEPKEGIESVKMVKRGTYVFRVSGHLDYL